MTKTITDLQPHICAQIFAQPERRRLQRTQVLWLIRWAVLPVLYTTISIKLAIVTGIPPWDPRFLIMFTPTFLVGEQAFIEIQRHWPKGKAPAGTPQS